jgi:hypothetical protein
MDANAVHVTCEMHNVKNRGERPTEAHRKKPMPDRDSNRTVTKRLSLSQVRTNNAQKGSSVMGFDDEKQEKKERDRAKRSIHAGIRTRVLTSTKI